MVEILSARTHSKPFLSNEGDNVCACSAPLRERQTERQTETERDLERERESQLVSWCFEPQLSLRERETERERERETKRERKPRDWETERD